MSTPNKVFYISRELNFIVSPATFDAYVENLLKSLVSGHGPFPVVSLKVVDKVATVDIGEPAKLYPGVKINIEGTTIAAIDSWHEIETVEGQTFTFNIDVPNGEYTAGITMGYPSLGWSLSDRSGNTFLLKNGNSGLYSRYTLLSFNKNKPSGNDGWRNSLLVNQVECDGTINSIRLSIPSPLQPLGMFITTEEDNPAAVDNEWYFYGDDSFVVMGYRVWWTTGTTQTKRANLYQCMFGELAKSPFLSGSWYLNAMENPQSIYTGDYTTIGYQIKACGYSGILGGYLKNFHSSNIATTTINSKNNFTAKVDAINSTPLGGERSGYDYGLSKSKYILNNSYGPIFIYDESREFIGSPPGIYFMYHLPGMVPAFTYQITYGGATLTIESFLKPAKPLGSLNKRKVYAFFSGGWNTYQAGSGAGNDDIYMEYQSTTLFDLTGPIR